MKSLKITHFFDVIKKEAVKDDPIVSPAVPEHNVVKQEYHCKEELDVPWDERDNDYGLNQENYNFSNDLSHTLGYPIVLLERLPNNIANDVGKRISVDRRRNEFETVETKKSEKKSFLQYYRKFCTECKKRVPSGKKTQKCKNCYIQYNYECKKCSKQVPSYGGIINHLTSKCIERGHYYACFKCNYKSTDKYAVNKHLKNVHSILHSLDRLEKFKSENVQKDVIPMAKVHRCSKCGKQFQKLPPLLKHMQICGQTKYNAQSENIVPTVNVVQDKCVHHCFKCNRTVKYDGIGGFLTKKCQICHSKCSFKCKQCNKIFHSHGGINRHLKTSHTISKDVFNCPECDYKTGFIDYLTKHFRSKHFIEPHECSTCGKKYKNRSAYKSHALRCNKEPEFECDHCSHKTKTKQALKLHICHVHAKGNDAKCPQCGITLKNNAVLKVHLTYCKRQSYYQCNSCSFKTKRNHGLTRHYKNVHSDVQEKETCPHCAKEYKKCSIDSHLLRCGGKFADLSCTYCSRLFRSKKELTQHVNRVHPKDCIDTYPYEVPYFHCNDCTYKTKMKGDLVKHVNTHMDDNTKECSTCKKHYKYEYFRRHVKYCGKEPLRCHHCNYHTLTKDCLKGHIANMHLKGNEIDCPKCGRMCKNKRYLRSHLQRCGTSPHLQCDHCSYKTKSKYDLRKHIEKLHSKLKKRRVA